jgi:diacylglycerol kinase family enzyme
MATVAGHPRKRLVIVNPHASRTRDAPTRRRLLRELTTVLEREDGHAPDVVETSRREETRPAVEAALADGVSGVVGVGGDGTLRDIADVLANTDATLGLVPAGSGNQLASALRIPRDPYRAIVALGGARARAIDLGEVALALVDRPPCGGVFTIGCGIGFDARLMATTPPSWKRRVGTLAYFVQALRLAPRVGAQPFRIRIDDRIIETEASVAMVGNLGGLVPGFLGPRLPLVPDDGLLDLIVVDARDPLRAVRSLADQLLRTSPGCRSRPLSLRLRGRHIVLRTEQLEEVEVDGDHVGRGSLEARVLPAALRVLVPPA